MAKHSLGQNPAPSEVNSRNVTRMGQERRALWAPTCAVVVGGGKMKKCCHHSYINMPAVGQQMEIATAPMCCKCPRLVAVLLYLWSTVKLPWV